MIDITKEEKFDFFENYWWVIIGLGICMWVQHFIFVGTAALYFNLVGTDSEQAALFLFNWMNHSTDIPAKLLGLSTSVGNIAIIPIILGAFIKLVRGD